MIWTKTKHSSLMVLGVEKVKVQLQSFVDSPSGPWLRLSTAQCKAHTGADKAAWKLVAMVDAGCFSGGVWLGVHKLVGNRVPRGA